MGKLLWWVVLVWVLGVVAARGNLTYNNCTDYYCVSCNYNTPYICLKCADGYYVTNNYACGRCSTVLPNCSRCYYDNVRVACTACEGTNRVLTNNSCPLCSSFIPYCSTCDVTYQCKTCQSGYVDDNNKTLCKECGGYISRCTRCRRSGEIVECTMCSDGLVAVSNVCVPCETAIRDCSSCTQREGGGYGCKSCKNGLFTDGSSCKLCGDWIEECLTCNQGTSSVECTSCANGKVVNLSGSKCISQSEKTWQIVGIVGGVLAAVAIGVGIFCYCRRKKHRQQQAMYNQLM